MPGGIYKVEQIVLALEVVDHTTCLCLHRNAALSLDIEFVQNLFIPARRDSARKFQESITDYNAIVSAPPRSTRSKEIKISRPVVVVGYFTSALSVILHSTTAVNQTGTTRFLTWGLTTCATMQKFLNLSKGIASILLSSCAVAFAELARSDVENSWAVAGVGRNDNRTCMSEVVPGRLRGRRSLLIKVHCRIGRVWLCMYGGGDVVVVFEVSA